MFYQSGNIEPNNTDKSGPLGQGLNTLRLARFLIAKSGSNTGGFNASISANIFISSLKLDISKSKTTMLL